MKQFILLCLGALLLCVGVPAVAQTGNFNILNIGVPNQAGQFSVSNTPNGPAARFAVNRNYEIDMTNTSTPFYGIKFGGQFAFLMQRGTGPLALFIPNGSDNNIAHLESGFFGDIFGSSKWLGLGSAPAGVGPSVYGKRIQWNRNFALFNLREVNSTTRDLVVQWGGTESNNRLLFEYTSSPTGPASTYMQIESDGRVGINGLRTFGGQDDQLYVNGRIGFGTAEYFEDGGANTITSQGSLIPSVNNSRDLGNSTFRWDDVFATNGVIQTSDRRDKTNIRDASYGLDEVLALRPVTYDWKMQTEKGTQVGLIAQEVNEVLPEIVYDPAEDMVMNEEGQMVPVEVTEDSRMGINYALFTPVLIKAIQEQNEVIKAQQAEIEALKRNDMVEAQQARIEELERKMSQLLGDENGSNALLPQLYQNNPNPFEGVTKIGYYLPTSVTRATLYVYDMQGNQVLEAPLQDRGESVFELDGNLFGAGMYLYALIADGKEVDVKRMILTKTK